ncbi:MAG: hypothetical protein IJ861_05580 [Clostridia bacterium]|nr:hypothetical protein [Clostridia bacterium]
MFFLNTTGKTQRKELQILMTYIRNNIPGYSPTDEFLNKIRRNRMGQFLRIPYFLPNFAYKGYQSL